MRTRPDLLAPGTGSSGNGRVEPYEVVALEDGFSWQGTRYRSLSAIARKITGTPWWGPLFLGLKHNRPATQRPDLPHELSYFGRFWN